VSPSRGTCWSTVLALVVLSGCDRPTQERAREPHANSAVAASPTPASTLDTMPLTLASMPSAAVEALRQFAPTFVPFADSGYPKAVVAAARMFGFHGLMVIRADLQGLERVDYAVAGTDATGIRVIALFAEANGTYLPVIVTNWSEKGTVLHAARPLQLMRDPPCARPCGSAVIIIPLGSAAVRGNERWVWAAAQRRFVLEEFPD